MLTDIFNKAELTLIKCGVLPETVQEAREEGIKNHKNIIKWFNTASDDDFFFHMSKIIFYSGFRANTVTSKIDLIRKYFGSHRKVADYDVADINKIMADDKMIRNRNKITSIVKNAREFKKLMEKYGSFRRYLLSFGTTCPLKEDETDILKVDLQRKFLYLGPATVNHLLTDYGFPVLKPDRMIMRVLYRAHLVKTETEDDFENAIKIGRHIAKTLNLPIRYIDTVLVSLGQVNRANICSISKPKCHQCELQKICNFYR